MIMFGRFLLSLSWIDPGRVSLKGTDRVTSFGGRYDSGVEGEYPDDGRDDTDVVHGYQFLVDCFG